MQNVPSLNRLMLTKAKVNSFIHCFVEVQKITSLHDLEIEICKSERVKSFEELKLKLGPIPRSQKFAKLQVNKFLRTSADSLAKKKKEGPP
ncbi:hypothetical protein HanXRQr2_Chr11g0481111 [Helianthus annuus]|uniref:Uncharacterized protein n=1 Tax=Helianthus annuus TaxID=4232 RepID=A0A9K3MZB0_HELAN|nr:hypothetical protein HanXRQr2_Chr11g0481111 [Helianthus annuus]KAJ0516765.1 hypothetical protein HanHA89_Chr11g0417451 [Helianthus annuus]KAJ0684767.1 hypothetical protein HanLR1_Chr11g0394841 [Helianthus annuus]KAJ0699789.1 hypothetical protein HanOQP8_Chr10g0360041 [Helianthus annuus]KAJ0883177.1 hypothetical protein HanPSC8_Chr10g0418441 [Helianthus annuus]